MTNSVIKDSQPITSTHRQLAHSSSAMKCWLYSELRREWRQKNEQKDRRQTNRQTDIIII